MVTSLILQQKLVTTTQHTFPKTRLMAQNKRRTFCPFGFNKNIPDKQELQFQISICTTINSPIWFATKMGSSGKSTPAKPSVMKTCRKNYTRTSCPIILDFWLDTRVCPRSQEIKTTRTADFSPSKKRKVSVC